ncbi:MAG: hypothetical protein QM767_29655 [Anaeromyxobacter sp.]
MPEKDDEHLAPESGDSPERERRARGDLAFEERRERSGYDQESGSPGGEGEGRL